MRSKGKRLSRRRDWIWLFIYALAVIAIGIFALLNPFAASLSLGIFLAIGLLAYGSILIAAGFLRRTTDWLEALLGFLTIITGVAALFMPLTATVSFVWMSGAWLLVAGIFGIISGLRTKLGRGWTLLVGALNILLGGYLLAIDPASALVYAALMVGISLIARGAFLAIAALNLREMRGQVAGSRA